MKNKREIYAALVAGEKLDNGEFLCCLNANDELVDDEGHKINLGFGYPKDWQIYKEPKLYENIPEGGVLCSVRNFDTQDWSILPYAVTHYMEGDTHPFCCYEKWKYAKPLTKQEIQVFLTNAPED